MANLLPNDTREFLGLGNGTPYNSYVTPPSFNEPDGMLTDKSASERKARFQASAEMLFKTDLSKLDDVGVSGLYQCVTEGMFGLKDTDGQIAFGKRASKNPRENIDMLRRFVKGDYTLIEDPEYTKWREMDEEGKFQYALENESKATKVKSHLKGERGASPLEVMFFGMAANPPSSVPGMARTFRPQEVNEAMDKQYADSARRLHYDALNDEEKAAYRADVIGDYEKKLSRRQTLATYLQFASNLSDKAAYYLAESFQKGTPDINVEMLDPEERDRVYSAFSLMRGDKKRGRILGIETDFTDDTVANRFQLGLYGLQQSLVGLVTDTGDMVRDGAIWAYTKATMDDAERKAFFEGWDANVRAERAMEQALPDAEGWFGAGFQGLMENVHWFIPYGAIGKGGKMMSAANKTVSRAKLQKEVFTGAKALAEMNAAAAKTRWLSDVQVAVKSGKGAKKVNEFQSALAMRRELAAVERYTKALEAIPGIQKAAKVRDAAGASMWAIGEASALSAFASEYVAAADAAGVSREESMITAWAIGLVNARIERLYVAGLESSLTASQVKALTFKALHNAVKSDGAAGFRKWFVNRVQRGVVEGAKITATEGLIEEPLQQLATEHGIEFNKLCAEMRKNGETDLADKAEALWQSFAKQLPEDYGVFIDTVVDSLPTSLAFGATGVGNMTRRQHLHNVITRHINRRAGSTSTMLTARNGQELMSAVDYDAGVIDIIQQAVNTRAAVENYWKGDESDEAKNPNRFGEAITAARRAYRKAQTRDVVQEVAEAAGVDVKTAEVLAQYLQNEEEMAAFSPQVRAFTSLNMSLADIDETTIKTVLPGYIEGSFAADEENGIYSGRVKLGDGTERTIAYRVGDLSAELTEQVGMNAALDSNFGKSFDARHAFLGDGVTWASLSDAQRYMEAVRSAASVNGFSSGKSGVFELTDAKGEKVRVNADDVIYLANGRLGDIGYGPAATMGTARHETFHSLWRFARATMDEEDVQMLARALGVDVTANGWEVDLDEAMAHQLEMYASGHYVSHAVSSRFDKMLDGWAGNVIKFFGSFGPADEVRDPKTGKSFALKDFYDMVLKGELGSGKLGVEVRAVPAVGAAENPTSGTMPVEVTDADRAAAEAETRKAAMETEKPVLETEPPVSGTEKPVSGTSEGEIVYTAENPADASVPNARYYKIGLPNSDVKLVGRLEVRDAHTGLTTSTDEDYHDRGNQNRDDRSEESRALVMKIAGHPDPLQIGTVQPIANNGIVWILNNSNVIIGNHRVNGVRAGYEKGTAGDLEKFVREDAAKRGIEIGEGVNAPLTVFVLERIESPDGKADVHEVVRLANESQNRGFNIREQAGNDAKILIDNNLLPRMAFRPDGRLDETKCADAIGKFRQESGAQGLIGEDGMLTEEGSTRIQNAAVAALLGGTGNNALLGRIMDNAGRLDMASQLRALMKVTPELMALAKTKPEFDIRDALAEALTLYTEWREKDEEKRSEKGKSRHDWRELDKEGKRKRGLSWEAFMSQGDMFRTPSEEAKILGDLFARTEQLRSFDREDVESAAGKKRVVDLITDYLTDYIENAKNVNTETEDMFGGTPASRAEVLAAQRAKGESGARFSMSAPVERSKNLIALHNLKPSDLVAAAELEGMPAPSIAVVKDSMGHDDYGPISFVFGAGVIDPKADRNNKIYSSDAWTPTRGSVNIEYKVLDEKLDEIIASLINAGDENYRKLFKAFSERGSLGDIAENAIAAGEYYRLWHNDAILLSYLNSKGQSVPLSYREQAISHNYSNAVVKGVSDAVGDKIAEIWENGGKTGDEEAVERMSEIMRPAAVKAKDDENPEGAAERRAKGVPTLGERLYGEALKRPWDLAKAVMQYREHGITEEIDTFAVSKTMSEMLSTDDPAYQEWVRSTFAPAVGAKGIRNKRELFTPSGSRRSWEALHDEVTAQRIVDMMYHNSKEVGGNGFGGYNPEGAAVRTYASITEMRRDRDRLKVMPEEEWKKLHDEARKDMIDAVSRLQSKQKGFYSDNSFIELDTIKDIVLQAWIDAKGDKTRYLSICKDELHVYDEETCGDIWDVMMRLRNAPTKYFEAKPERVVGFDEVAFAVIPDDSSAETIDILKTRGIETHTYKAEDKEDRLRVLNEAANAKNVRFSIGGFHGALATGKVGLLREADKMEKGGASREEIWRTTGWWRGKDGKWRVELPDIQMRSKREIEAAVKLYGNSISLGELVVAPELFKAYPALEETRIILDNDYFTSSTRGSFDPSTKDITLNGKGQISLANLPYADRSDYDSAIDKVSSDDHLNNWIEISKELGIEVGTFDEEREKAKSKIEEIEKRIVEKNRARLQSLDSDETRSILAHEIQHWIQKNEGFAKGGNIQSIREARALNKEIVRDVKKALNQYGYEAWDKAVLDSSSFVNDIKAASQKWPKSRFLLQHMFAESRPEKERDYIHAMLDKFESIYNENAKEAHYGYTDEDAYLSLLGEVEARNVQKRLDMSPEERAATPPWETESVPENRQIVRFSMSVNPKLGEDIREAVNTDRNTKAVVSGHKEVVFASHAPEVLIASGIPDGRIYTHAFILRKMKDDHDLDEVAIENLVSSAQSPAAILHDVDKKKGTEAFIILTEQTAKDLNGRVAPVMIYLRPDSNGNYIASAYARTEKGEKHYIGLLNSGSLLAINKSKVAGLNLTGEAKSSFESVRTDDNVVDLERFTPQIISNSLPENNGPSAELLEAMGRKAADEKKNAEKNSDEKRMYSIAPDMTGGIFPEISRMSDDELVTAAVAVRMALGETGKFSDRAVKVNTVNKLIRRLHPEYKSTDVGRESMRVISDARKFAKKIREDLDRGVSDSLILEHLPQTAREQFGREMVEEARRGQRLGRFGQKVTDKLEDRQARIVEDAVRIQTGMDVSLMENLYGINLSETLMHLAENPLTEKPPQSPGAGEGETAEAVEESAGEETEPVDVSAAVQAAVNEIVGAAKTATDANERNREDRRAAAGRDAERAAELGGEEPGAEGGAGEDFGGEDIVAIATKKAKLDLENPRHLAEFVAELTRRYWIKEHELGQNAEVWRDLVAVQFLRKTAQGIYAKLCKDLTYSRSRETAMQRIAKFDHAATVQGLLTEMEFVGALINAQRIRDTQKALCEKLDLFLRQKFGAQGRFKPDKEEGKRNVSAEAELRARYMRHAMWLTPDAAAEEARELQEKLDLLAVEFTDAGRDRDQSREFVETIRKLNVLREFGALRYKSVGEIEAAAKWWEDFERGESDDIVREMSDRDIRTKKAAELLAKAFADPKRVTVREGATTADRINKFLTGHMGFVALLNDCMRHATDADRAAVKDIVGYIQREIQKAGDGTATEKRHHNDAFHAAVESIYAKSFNKVMKEMMAEDDRFLKFMGEVGGKRDIPTKGRAMQLLVSLLQEGRKIEVEDEENPGKTKFIYEGGYHDNIVRHKREGQAAELMKLMSPADMNMIKWLGMWYEQNRQDLSRVCHSLFGIGVYAELPNYFPVKMRLDKQGLEKGAAVGWTIFPKALTPRVKNERDFDTSADIFQMWSSRMEEGAQWKHHAQLGLEMRGIFGRAELQGAVISNHGEATNALMQGFITDVLAGKGAVDRSTGDVQYISDKIRGWTALCALGGNVGVMLKQTTSIPAFGFEIGLVDTARHIVSAFTPEGLAAMGKIWQSEQRKTRWDVGNSEAVANALNKQDAGWLKRAFQASMITNKLGDVVPALVVGQGVYRDCIARGMSEADAMAETWMLVERTQQSSRMENLASVQRRNRVGRIMFQFLSTQRQYLDYELRAIREVIAQPSSVNRWKKLGTTILLNHFILTSAYYWMGQLYKAMLGQEPPEDELTDWVITCLLGPYGSLFVAGFCCNYTLQRALKGYSYGGGSSMLPMESWLKNQVNDGAKLVEAIFDSEGDTWDNMLDAAGKWMSDLNSLFRDLRKIYRFRIQEEPQKKR